MKHPGLINSIKDNEKDLFEWSETNFLKVKKIIEKYPSGRKQSAVIPLLDLAQRQNKGWLNKKALEKVAETLSMSFIRVLEVATFYSMFNLKPIGKNYIQICRTTPCWLRGSDKLLNIAKEVTGCTLGETSKDKKFTVVEGFGGILVLEKKFIVVFFHFSSNLIPKFEVSRLSKSTSCWMSEPKSFPLPLPTFSHLYLHHQFFLFQLLLYKPQSF